MNPEEDVPTCQWGEGEMLGLAALPLAVDDAEVDFDSLADGRVSVGRHLHKQHILQKQSAVRNLRKPDARPRQRPHTHRLALIFVH